MEINFYIVGELIFTTVAFRYSWPYESLLLEARIDGSDTVPVFEASIINTTTLIFNASNLGIGEFVTSHDDHTTDSTLEDYD